MIAFHGSIRVLIGMWDITVFSNPHLQLRYPSLLKVLKECLRDRVLSLHVIELVQTDPIVVSSKIIHEVSTLL